MKYKQIVAILRSSNPKIRIPLAISLGAIAGALTRYYLTLTVNHWLGTSFPFSIFLINLSGALLMGFFTTLALEKSVISADLRLTIATGFLGSYTTFSTYALDTAKLFHNTSLEITGIYGLGSTIIGFLCLELGSYLARKWS